MKHRLRSVYRGSVVKPSVHRWKDTSSNPVWDTFLENHTTRVTNQISYWKGISYIVDIRYYSHARIYYDIFTCSH